MQWKLPIVKEILPIENDKKVFHCKIRANIGSYKRPCIFIEPLIIDFIYLTVLMFHFLRQIEKFHLFNQSVLCSTLYDRLESFIFLINTLEICLPF